MFKPTPDLKRSFNTQCSKLMHCISCGDSSKFETQLQKALSNGYPINYSPNTDYMPLLTMAINKVQQDSSYKESERIVEILIEQGADVNYKDNYGYNALITAALNKDISPDLFERIAANTTDVNHKNNTGETAFDILTRTYTDPEEPERTRNTIITKCKILLDHGAVPDWNKSKEKPEKEHYRKKLYDLMTIYEENKRQLQHTTIAYDYEISL